MEGTDKTLRIGVVGAGYLGKFHAEKYARMPGVLLAGVADIDGAAAAQVAQRNATRAFSDHRELFGRVDAVSVVVPTAAHFEVARDFLSRDVDVLLEKPMTTRLEEADALIHLAASRGRILQVGHLERFNPALLAVRDQVKKPMFVESHRLSTFKGRSTDVSVVLDLMIHDIDLISSFVGSELREVRAAGVPVVSGEVDIANARLEFASGCIANVTASRISMKNERKLRLFQKGAYLSVDFGKREITVIRLTGEPSPGPLPGMDINRFCFTEGDALAEELSAFVRSVRTRSAPAVSGLEGREALRIALEIMDKIGETARRLLGEGPP